MKTMILPLISVLLLGMALGATPGSFGISLLRCLGLGISLSYNRKKGLLIIDAVDLTMMGHENPIIITFGLGGEKKCLGETRDELVFNPLF